MFDEFTFAWRYGPYIRFNFDGRSYQVETPLTDVLAFKTWLESFGAWEFLEPQIRAYLADDGAP